MFIDQAEEIHANAIQQKIKRFIVRCEQNLGWKKKKKKKVITKSLGENVVVKRNITKSSMANFVFFLWFNVYLLFLVFFSFVNLIKYVTWSIQYIHIDFNSFAKNDDEEREHYEVWQGETNRQTKNNH